MKSKYLLASAVALTLAAGAQAADVTVDITGATAFRTATLAAIKERFASTGQPFKFAHDQANAGGAVYTGATRAIFIGTFPGVTGTTTIRTSFNGSVEGIRALVESPAADPTYLLPSVLASTTAVVGGAELHNTSAPVAADASEIAFSDVSIAATPLSGSVAGSPAGVVTFTMLLNEGTGAGAAAPFTNITSQQFKALMGAGYLPLSVFTGDAADRDRFVFATGRNDGSGTRTTYLAETGYGIANPVRQYITRLTSGDTITRIQLVPAGDGSNASIIWGNDMDGNGGYSSGSALRGDMARTTGATQVLDADGSELFPAGPLHLVTFLSTGDSVNAVNGGAKLLSYNGVGITPSSGGLNATDKAKVVEGLYTAWSYQQMYRRGDITSGDALTVYNQIRTNMATSLGSAGIPIAEMYASRTEDGGAVAP
jgi:hypothetical protein